MKTANFTYKSTSVRGREIFGKVTLNDSGKISVNLFNAKSYSPAERYAAKALANNIVKANFKHEAVTSFQELASFETGGLVSVLTNQTQDFKADYIVKVKEYAKNYFEYVQKELAKPITEWYDKFGVKWEMKSAPSYATDKTPKAEPVSGEYNRKNIYSMRNKIEQFKSIIAGGFEKFEGKEVKDAENHYAFSIEKLAYRLNQKGIVDGSQFEVTTARIGINLEITIKHGTEITRAFTVSAEGQIQRFHYRYLVK